MNRIIATMALVVLSGCATKPTVWSNADGSPPDPNLFYQANARCYRYAQLDMNPLDGWKYDMCMQQEGYRKVK